VSTILGFLMHSITEIHSGCKSLYIAGGCNPRDSIERGYRESGVEKSGTNHNKSCFKSIHPE